MQLSTLIGKPVLTRAGDRLGYVTAALLTRDMKKISSLLCANDDEEEFCIPARAILSAADAVIAGGARLKAPTGIASPIGKPAYTHTGEALGTLTDVELGDEPALLIASGATTLRCAAACATIGETVIVYPSAAERRPVSARRSHAPKKTENTRTMSAQRRSEPTMPAEQRPKSAPDGHAMPKQPPAGGGVQSPPSMPEARPSKTHAEGFRIDRTNLLGRRVKRSVYDETGTPIAVAGERITPQTIALARRKNRLLALTVNTLTNLY